MNNAQFRKLLETPRPPPPSSSPNNDASTPARALGSRQRSSIPMTPRSLVANTDFARQLAARRAAQQPQKKFRSSAAPKGTKYGEGYVDRAKLREQEDEKAAQDERAQRLEALEKLAKEGVIDREEYVKQTKLLGGDIKNTHLVKGLDFALLRRVKAGEDVMAVEDEEKEEQREEALDDKLDAALEKEFEAKKIIKEKKKGELAAKPKTRAEILAEMKERKRAEKNNKPALGSKFRKIGAPNPKEEDSDEEKDIKVKHVMGPDGKIKRKIKRSDKERERRAQGLDMPPPKAKPLGMEPPLLPKEEEKPAVDEDDDIFSDAGEYNPLAGIADSDSDSSSSSAGGPPKRPKPGQPTEEKEVNPSSISSSMPPPPAQPRQKINYFNEPSTTLNDDTYRPPTSASDLLASNPGLAAALAKAGKLDPTGDKRKEEERKWRLLEDHERDSYDIDMGFGGSTNFDDDDDVIAGSGSKGKKRKRNRKKGDKNNAEVVGKIVEEKYGT